jgi:hypothetical protein
MAPLAWSDVCVIIIKMLYPSALSGSFCFASKILIFLEFFLLMT